MKKAIIMAAFLGLIWPSSLVAQMAPTIHAAQTHCAPYEKVTGELKKKYNEGQAAIGLANNGQVFQIFSTKGGGSWTVLMTKPSGETCLMIAGEGLELIETLEGIEISYPLEK